MLAFSITRMVAICYQLSGVSQDCVSVDGINGTQSGPASRPELRAYRG